MPVPRETLEWHAADAERVLAACGSSSRGLTAAEAAERLDAFGANQLVAQQGPSVAALIVKQLRSPLIYMLFAAAVLSALAGHYVDSAVVAAVLVLNTLIGVSQEWRAEKALEALRKMAAPQARVLRDGEITRITAEDVVFGDVLVLETGDRVAADARMLHSTDLRVDESALTGESDTVGKDADPLDADTPMADRRSMVWMTTSVTDGRGTAVVVATGMDSVIGNIAGEVQEAGQDETPLQKRLASLGTVIGAAALGFAVFVFFVGLARGYEIVDMMLFAVAAAVSAIPEGLPAVISVVLAVGVQRMGRRNAIVRRLPAVETLGSTTVICSDKTGTITRNEMTVTRLWAGGRDFEVSGVGFSPEGAIRAEEDPDSETDEFDRRSDVGRLLVVGILANNAELSRRGESDRWGVEGSPTEGALLAVALKGGLDTAVRDSAERLDEIAFSSRFKYMATLDRLPEHGVARLHVKGAYETILQASDRILIDGEEVPLTEELRERADKAADTMTRRALRVVAGGYRDLDREEADRSHAESGLVFVGMWGLLDPPRESAIAAIADAQRAGISVKMITGDHAATAEAISLRAGLLGEGGGRVVTGQELDSMSDDELQAAVEDIAVFARVSPTHKLRIVDALQTRGQVVAMTGDGVNDAPALKRADIGISMGITGTEVAKESSDMILTDDDFATIVAAVEEGRVIFDNLRRVVMFLLTTNLGEILAIIAALIIGLPLPLTAIMILWVNLVTDGVSVIPLGLEPKHSDVLARKPRPTTEGVLTARFVRRIVVLAPVIAAGTLGVFAYMLPRTDHVYAQTMAFTTLVAFEWVRAFSTRSLTVSAFSMNPFSNRLLIGGIGVGVLLQFVAVYWGPAQTVFDTAPLALRDWGIALAVASSVLFADEALKLHARSGTGSWKRAGT
jgi:P-type Ca2+ transporter type 2C